MRRLDQDLACGGIFAPQGDLDVPEGRRHIGADALELDSLGVRERRPRAVAIGADGAGGC